MELIPLQNQFMAMDTALLAHAADTGHASCKSGKEVSQHADAGACMARSGNIAGGMLMPRRRR